MPRLSVFLVALYALFAATPAHAVCSSPAGAAGRIIYNADNKIIQYCDGTNWTNSASGNGRRGTISSTAAGTWNDAGQTACTSTSRLYCFQQ